MIQFGLSKGTYNLPIELDSSEPLGCGRRRCCAATNGKTEPAIRTGNPTLEAEGSGLLGEAGKLEGIFDRRRREKVDQEDHNATAQLVKGACDADRVGAAHKSEALLELIERVRPHAPGYEAEQRSRHNAKRRPVDDYSTCSICTAARAILSKAWKVTSRRCSYPCLTPCPVARPSKS